MTFAYWMLIAAAMMPYLTMARAKSAGGIDNRRRTIYRHDQMDSSAADRS
jgi:hypothetical protein